MSNEAPKPKRTKRGRKRQDPYRSMTTICQQCGAEVYISCCELWTWKITRGNKRLYFCSYPCRKAKLQSLEAEKAERYERTAAQRKETLARKKAAEALKEGGDKHDD